MAAGGVVRSSGKNLWVVPAMSVECRAGGKIKER